MLSDRLEYSSKQLSIELVRYMPPPYAILIFKYDTNFNMSFVFLSINGIYYSCYDVVFTFNKHHNYILHIYVYVFLFII